MTNFFVVLVLIIIVSFCFASYVVLFNPKERWLRVFSAPAFLVVGVSGGLFLIIKRVVEKFFEK